MAEAAGRETDCFKRWGGKGEGGGGRLAGSEYKRGPGKEKKNGINSSSGLFGGVDAFLFVPVSF